MPVNTEATRFCGVLGCFAPRCLSRPDVCENYHKWCDNLAVGPDTVLAYHKNRLMEVERQIDEAERWGAYLSVLGSEQKGLRSAVRYWEEKTRDIQA